MKKGEYIERKTKETEREIVEKLKQSREQTMKGIQNLSSEAHIYLIKNVHILIGLGMHSFRLIILT
jgi:hypothetical protein